MLPYNEKNLSNARQNRKQRNSTKEEGILWHCYLKKCPINFTRQYRVGNYILDFYAPSIKLAVELDGSQHYEEKNEHYEKERTDFLEKNGITVLRFINADINKHLKRTVEQIEFVLKKITGKPIY